MLGCFFKLWKEETKKAAKAGARNDGEHAATTRRQVEKVFNPDVLGASRVKLTVFDDRRANILRFKLLLSVRETDAFTFSISSIQRKGRQPPQIKG